MSSIEFDIPEDHRIAFQKYYKQKVAPKCSSFEAKREGVNQRRRENAKFTTPICYICITVILGAFAGLLGVQFMLVPMDYFVPLMIVAFLPAPVIALAVIASGKESDELYNAAFEKLYPISLKYFGDDFALTRAPKVDFSTFIELGLLPKTDKQYAQNCLKGTYKKVPFQFYEVDAYNTKSNDNGSVQRETIFNGVLLVCNIPKKFNSTTLLVTDKGSLKNRLEGFKTKLLRVKLEDVRFERSFEVYSSDQVEARYLLNPLMMESLLALSRELNAEVEACFYQKQLLIKIPTKHHFFINQLDLDRPINFKRNIEQMFTELGYTFSIIDTLKLDKHTGL
ncbi:DUF3137 domain-containing protein [Shewanella baltica]|uniref:DUF3137 domain-containing protein n=1 Tax=Shewanella baltica TaxID=62322 RepID=UPI0001E109CA|nr:DUF3137 domain-containing protein [Shewanella baltica]AEG09398.1 hypothetical protein Sbal175_0095 [Shewanella baltica BA175]EHQ17086.1 hypothetical protein Sbal183_4225 [Shewanella baltica OS183]MCS6124359.1 DUF3137 domain-containing protein [Shewanella baltica]MCS6237252.1 DUF3137 domain-containing protein [Shewanella baltica]MCS6271694.1 DUF3137 domain-containing protein [Shewanella baltica]